jgi:hypothetical protein
MVSARGGDNLFNIDREHHPVAFPHLDLIQASGTTYFVHVGVNLAVQSCHRSQGRSDKVTIMGGWSEGFSCALGALSISQPSSRCTSVGDNKK